MKTHSTERLKELIEICHWQAQIAHCPHIKAQKIENAQLYQAELEKRKNE